MSAAAVSAHYSGSPHIRNAGIVVALLYVSSNLFWFAGQGIWRYVGLDVFAVLYFYSKWSAPDSQHRTFHFLLMCPPLISTAFFAFQLVAASFAADAVAMSPWWYQLLQNVLFLGSLVLIIGYGLLKRRADKDKKKWRSDVDGWFSRGENARAKSKAKIEKKPGDDARPFISV